MSAQEPTKTELVASAVLGALTVLVFYVALLLAPDRPEPTVSHTAPVTSVSAPARDHPR